jgi:hypothetical protein
MTIRPTGQLRESAKLRNWIREFAAFNELEDADFPQHA